MNRTLTRSLALRLLAAAIGLLLALLAAEVAFRLLPAGAGGFRSTKFDNRHKLPGPDFRDRGFEPEKEPGVFRILAVGDSYTWGHGLHPEDAYPDRLGRRLREADPQVRYEVVNWSLPGWNTLDEFRSLREAIEEWSPDLLLVGFVLNDPEPSRQDVLREIREPLERRTPTNAASRWLFSRSRLYSRTFEALENRRMKRALVAYYRGLYDGEFWETCQDALRKIKRLARQRKIPMLVVVFPIFDSQLDHRYRYRDLHDTVSSGIEELGIPTFDLLPVYEGIDGRRLALEPYTDPHPSELGQRIAADAILWYLVKNKLIPTRRLPR